MPSATGAAPSAADTPGPQVPAQHLTHEPCTQICIPGSSQSLEVLKTQDWELSEQQVAESSGSVLAHGVYLSKEGKSCSEFPSGSQHQVRLIFFFLPSLGFCSLSLSCHP